MKKLVNLVVVLFLAVTFMTTAFAQKKDFKPGEKIECKTSYSKDEWTPCTFVEQTYDGSQPVTRDAQGFQKALPNWDWVRSAAAATGNNPPEIERNTGGEKTATEDMAGPQGQGLMSQADIITFLRTNLGTDPFGNPRRYDIKSKLADEIKRRGLNFHFDPLAPFFNEASKYIGMDTEITNPLHDNFGPPTKQSFLTGKWKLDIVGATTLYEKNGDVYRKEASAAANVGILSIDPDGTYLWRASAPAATFQGKWRSATPAEMMSQGGDGIVLLGAKSGWDWIVTQLRGSTVLKGDVIYVSYINGRGVREIGSR